MLKRGRFIINNLVFGQIFLIVFSVFSFAFLIGGGEIVSGQIRGEFEDPSRIIGSGLDSTGAEITTGGSVPPPIGPGPPPGPNPVVPGDTPVANKPTDSNFFSDLYGGTAFGAEVGTLGSALIQGVSWGGTAYIALKAITSLLGLDEGLSDAISTAGGAGFFAGFFAANLAKETVIKDGVATIVESNPLGMTPGTFGPVIGISVAVIVFVLLYSEESVQRVDFQCLPWDAPVKGEQCEKCNENEFRPCSEYRCKSLGQACELVNEGSEEEKCVWVNPRDVTSPTITPWQKVLNPGLSYSSHETRPPARGTKIIRNSVRDGCLQAFTPLIFGITTNEPAQCKVDIVHRDTFDEMQFFFGGSNFFIEEHEQRMSLPSPDAINAEAPTLQNDGRYELFVRCRDKNGNDNDDEYAVQFCVDPSPDTTAPVIVDTSILNGNPVSFNIDEVPLEVYVNEPSECKWSIQDKSYDNMENQMSCATSLTQINARELYTCSTSLTGIQNNLENKFYFRCKDQPKKIENERNVNEESYEFALIGSQPLNIIRTAPNETITGSTSVVDVTLEVETDDGVSEGEAVCYFSDTGNEGDYIQMFETGTFEHKQILTLPGGSYEYFFRCVDLGGNAAEKSIQFDVYVDNQAPIVTRAYHILDALKIVTDENAVCKYSLNTCNFVFEEGLPMINDPPRIKTAHYEEWFANQIYHIKCKDEFGNQPSPNDCSIVVSATSIS